MNHSGTELQNVSSSYCSAGAHEQARLSSQRICGAKRTPSLGGAGSRRRPLLASTPGLFRASVHCFRRDSSLCSLAQQGIFSGREAHPGVRSEQVWGPSLQRVLISDCYDLHFKTQVFISDCVFSYQIATACLYIRLRGFISDRNSVTSYQIGFGEEYTGRSGRMKISSPQPQSHAFGFLSEGT